MDFGRLAQPGMMVPLRLEDRNRLAQDTIDKFKTKHATMDVGVGLIGLVPGAGLPALITAIAMQSPIIYQPLAKELAQLYLAAPRDLEGARSNIVYPAAELDIILSITADFGGEFIKQIAGEMVADVGIGTAATLIPFVGAVVAAALDYTIATRMTARVGQMVSIYFQNGVQWYGTRDDTYEAAKNLRGGLDSIRKEFPGVMDSLRKNVQPMVEILRSAGMTDAQIRSALFAEKVPIDVIDEALRTTTQPSTTQKI
jgi:hypothetical protein